MKPLDDRIAALRTEIDQFIDGLVAREQEQIKGVPAGVLRKAIVGYNTHCLCTAYLELSKKEAAA